MRDYLNSVYLDYFNNYLTVDKFAEHNGLTYSEALELLKVAKSCHENPHPEA